MAVAMKQKPLSVSQGIPRTSVGGVVNAIHRCLYNSRAAGCAACATAYLERDRIVSATPL